MPYAIKQSSTQSVLLFFMTDSADHISAKTGLTCTVTISKNGGSFASPSGAVSEIANGWYKVAGNATDTNTLGPLALHATATGADACDIIVAEIVAYDPQTGTNLGLSALPTANPGAANGVLIAGTNVATTFNGVAASGATPATAGLTITGGAASTTGGGTSAPAISATGGAGAATTNGASEGIKAIGGGTTTVSGAQGITTTGTGNKSGLTATGAGTGHGIHALSGTGATGDGILAVSQATNGNGVTATHAGTGQDLNATTTPLTLAKTTNITGFNDIAATAIVSSGAITTSGGAVTTVTNVTTVNGLAANVITATSINAAALNGKGDWNVGKTGYSLSAAGISAIWQDTTAGDFTAAGSIGKSIMNGVTLGTGLTVNDITTKTGYALTAAYDPAKTAAQAGDAMALTSAERNSTADALLGRNVAGGSSTGRLVKEALYVLRNKTDIQSGTLTVYGTDDTTSAFTAAVTTAAGNPITTIDPA